MSIDKDNPQYNRIHHNKHITKNDCLGCEDDLYNDKNNLNVKECWLFSKAFMTLKKKVSVDQIPPWEQKPIRVPSCYHVKRYVFVEKDTTH